MNATHLKKIQRAAETLSQAPEAKRDIFLSRLSGEIRANARAILSANVADVKKARTRGLGAPLLARLALDPMGIALMSKKTESVKKLKSGVGEIIESKRRGDFTLQKLRVPLGVIMVIYEARPEVTVEVAALAVKSGNAVILKGGSEALKTNATLYRLIRAALRKAGLPEEAVQFVETADRRVTDRLLAEEGIDLVIARGGYAMVKAVMAKTKIPVLAHSAGGARVYVDRSADMRIVEKILLNAKTTKPAACNSLDTVLIDRAIAKTAIPRIARAMRAAGVTVLRSMDWDEETLAPIVGIKVVKGIAEALAFIALHGKRHTEGIIARDRGTISKFVQGVDAAALFVNASPRLHDGYVFGLGAEMGISTSKLHARGPVGLKELTTYKWVAYGTGSIRK
jgi:glutamate-5-semialdehyde dehydrogenase